MSDRAWLPGEIALPVLTKRWPRTGRQLPRDEPSADSRDGRVRCVSDVHGAAERARRRGARSVIRRGQVREPPREGTRPARHHQVVIQPDGRDLAGNAAATGSGVVARLIRPARSINRSVAGRALDRLQAGPDEAPSFCHGARVRRKDRGRWTDRRLRHPTESVIRRACGHGREPDPSFDGEGEVLMQVGRVQPNSGVSGVTHQSDGPRGQ